MKENKNKDKDAFDGLFDAIFEAVESMVVLLFKAATLIISGASNWIIKKATSENSEELEVPLSDACLKIAREHERFRRRQRRGRHGAN